MLSRECTATIEYLAATHEFAHCPEETVFQNWKPSVFTTCTKKSREKGESKTRASGVNSKAEVSGLLSGTQCFTSHSASSNWTLFLWRKRGASKQWFFSFWVAISKLLQSSTSTLPRENQRWGMRYDTVSMRQNLFHGGTISFQQEVFFSSLL